VRHIRNPKHENQAASPGTHKESNWLPAPGPFILVVRDFRPRESMLEGTYKLPAVRKVQ
jgi:hypothetical protein